MRKEKKNVVLAKSCRNSINDINHLEALAILFPKKVDLNSLLKDPKMERSSLSVKKREKQPIGGCISMRLTLAKKYNKQVKTKRKTNLFARHEN